MSAYRQRFKTDLERFIEKIVFEDNGCWRWVGGKSKKTGYGRFWWNGDTRGAHVFIYEFYHGHVVYELDHLCRNRWCVNPDHLEDVTRQTNADRGDSFRRNLTHCLKGHEFTEDNIEKDARGNRHCIKCRRARAKKYRDAKKVA